MESVRLLRPPGGGWPAADGLPHAGPGVLPGPARSVLAVLASGDDPPPNPPPAPPPPPPPDPPRAPTHLPFPLHGQPPAGRRGWPRLRRAGEPRGGHGYIPDYIVLTMRAAAAGHSLGQ